eukprot:COSAG02_NODE_24039_length_699_cov_2.141667_1_plen_29_part_10
MNTEFLSEFPLAARAGIPYVPVVKGTDSD